MAAHHPDPRSRSPRVLLPGTPFIYNCALHGTPVSSLLLPCGGHSLGSQQLAHVACQGILLVWVAAHLITSPSFQKCSCHLLISCPRTPQLCPIDLLIFTNDDEAELCHLHIGQIWVCISPTVLFSSYLKPKRSTSLLYYCVKNKNKQKKNCSTVPSAGRGWHGQARLPLVWG